MSASFDGMPARGADQGGTPAVGEFVLPGAEHHLSPAAEAALAHAMAGFCGAWRDGPAKTWGLVHSQRKVAGTEFDQRVSRALVQCFFQANNLVCALEMLRLELQECGVVSEQSILRVEQLLHEPSCCFVDEVAVPHAYQRLGNVLGGGQRGGDGVDLGDVHGQKSQEIEGGK